MKHIALAIITVGWMVASIILLDKDDVGYACGATFGLAFMSTLALFLS